MTVTDTCHECGNEYKSLAGHWAKSDCSYPRISEHQQEVCTGLMMGDGTICRGNHRPYISVSMVTKDYLQYLSDEVFPKISNGVRLRATAKELAKVSRESGFHEDAKEENYSDQYQWYSMSHPDLRRYEEWYSTGEKVFPEDINLTPAVLKQWFCGDGNLKRGKTPRIAMYNERENRKKIESMFHEMGLTDFCWVESNKSLVIQFNREDAERFFEYIGKPLPGFEYRWPERMR